MWFESNRVRLKGATETKYLDVMRTHIIPGLGGIKISNLNANVINTFLNEKLKSGSVREHEALSPSYVRTMAVIIGAAVNYAVSEELCDPIRSPIRKPSVPKSDIKVLSAEVEAKLTISLLSDDSPTALGTLLALQSGLRLGEVCALRWRDIDFENGIIHVKHTISRVASDGRNKKTVQILDKPKTDASLRSVPMTSTLKNVLQSAGRKSSSDFTVSESGTFVSTRTFDYRYKKMLERHGFEKINFHALRHTFATRCAENGMDAKTLSRLLGHSSASTTLNIYVHPSMEGAKRQLESMYGVI